MAQVKRLVLLHVMFLFFLCVSGCGGGGNAVPEANLLTGFNWYFENSAPDYSNNVGTCFLVARAYYDESLAQSDISSFTLTSPDGWRWAVSASNLVFGANSANGKPYVAGRLYSSANPQTFPLAGVWTAEIKLTSGKSSTLQGQFHNPGTTTTATYPYVFTKEDFTPSANASSYAALLGRFPSQGYAIQYLPANGGSITSTGLSAVLSNYLATEPHAYNYYCWLYDVNNNYLGYTNTQYSSTDHSSTGLVINGELSIVPAATRSVSGSVDLQSVKFLRMVVTDGAQFAPASYSTIDNRSISALIPVH